MFQRITLIGFVGQEPQMRYSPDGTPVTNFSVATRQVVSKERVAACPTGWKESLNGKSWEVTTWWRVACWRGLAETVNQYVTKGRLLYVEGTLTGEASEGAINGPRTYTRNDGSAGASFELTARTVKFLGGSNGGGGAPVGEAPPEGYEEDSLPF